MYEMAAEVRKCRFRGRRAEVGGCGFKTALRLWENAHLKEKCQGKQLQDRSAGVWECTFESSCACRYFFVKLESTCKGRH